VSHSVTIGDPFLEVVVQVFPTELGPSGEPSAQDFLDFELPAIVFSFGEMWDLLPHWSQHPHYRYKHFLGRIAYIYYVIGEELADGSIELVHLDVDNQRPSDDET